MPESKIKNFYIHTFGCSLNKADSILMRNLVEKLGYKYTNDLRCAEYVIVNTCTVKNLTLKKVLKYLRETKSLKDKKLIIAGCLTYNEELLNKEFEDIPRIKPQEIHKILEYLSKDSQINIVEDKYSLPLITESRIVQIPINDGCASFCTFCATKLARPQLRSFSEERILANLKQALLNNAYEIQLTSQDSGAYGLDRKTNLINLLEKIEKLIKNFNDKNFRIRLGMMNPVHLKNFYVELADILKTNDYFYSFLHIPIQSGSNMVLEHMLRKNTVEEFIDIVKYLRKNVKDIFIMTDVIVGYPTEKESDFEQTLEMLKVVKPETTNVSKYSAMPKTYAATLKQIPKGEIERRSKITAKLCKEIEHNARKKYVNSISKVFVTEKNKTITGRLQNYIQVALPSLNESYLGTFVNAKIISLKYITLFAEPVVEKRLSAI
ncbi:MAG: tRNA (N(6)-L-threonylcarbamoyladenosine(37)-C(2))-methylthiotransferase [Candidatus Anstonellales archaeon]